MTLIGVQLWTLRDELEDLPRLFDGLAASGVQAVEPFGLGDPALSGAERVGLASRYRNAADGAGLEILSAHMRLPAANNVEAFLEEAAALGISTAIAAVPESLAGYDREAFSSIESIRRYADSMNELAGRVSEHGLAVGYHNHSWEWNLLADGTLAYDRLWEYLDQAVVAEVDVLWSEFAGQDAVEIVTRLSDRVRLLHVGDAAPITNVEHQEPAGAGDAPLVAAMAAAEGRLEAVYIEATTPPPGSSALQLVTSSSRWLREQLTALAL